ncbi:MULTISPECIES: hypothetical protein [unclassified Mesorhizobium]|nr:MULTISPECIES: hypothetical protein [unclassified Mesorhizobium]
MIEHPASISALPTNISALIDRWHGIGAVAAVGISSDAIAPQGEAA